MLTGQRLNLTILWIFAMLNLPRHMWPQEIIITTSFPMNAHGKVIKSELRKYGIRLKCVVSAGFLIYHPLNEPIRTVIQQMLEMVRHRGPDGIGIYSDENVALGNARLSIIDLDTGDQPISNENETLWIVLNGEIFNYIELRQDLERRGHRFKTKSDTETLLHAI